MNRNVHCTVHCEGKVFNISNYGLELPFFIIIFVFSFLMVKYEVRYMIKVTFVKFESDDVNNHGGGPT
jgi:hypothetical protein